MRELLALLVIMIGGILLIKITNTLILPLLIEKTTVKLEKNPKWLMPKLQQNYYGFSNLDIITARSPIGAIPRFHLYKEKNGTQRIEFLIPEDTLVGDINEIAKLALSGKLYIYYGLRFPDKSAYWLSILLFMLDGGDIQQKDVILENKTR